MSLAPPLDAAPAVPLHGLVVMRAFVLGLVLGPLQPDHLLSIFVLAVLPLSGALVVAWAVRAAARTDHA